jgi:cleavage and polyadenylation specificity factor subunit 4
MTEVQTPLASVAPDQEVEKAGQALYSFNFSDFLRREYRFGLDPNRPSCKAYMQGHCPLGTRCPDRHHVSSSYNKYVNHIVNAHIAFESSQASQSSLQALAARPLQKG